MINNLETILRVLPRNISIVVNPDKIEEIRIRAQRPIILKNIDEESGINLIYGQNEAGKSTLIKFIINSFYGISKNKKGKEISDFEKYKPWSGEEFSGKLEYELDNNEKYEIYKDFYKKKKTC